MRPMGDVHQLILRHGVDGARAMADTKAERQAVDAAAAILADEESRLGITHAGFAMTSLPALSRSPALAGMRWLGHVRRMPSEPTTYPGYRFPAEVIHHATWLYHVFSLSLR